MIAILPQRHPQLVFLLLLLLLSTFPISHADESMTCEADDETCEKHDYHEEEEEEDRSNERFTVSVLNKSKFRVDLYWDDGRFGTSVATLEAKGGTGKVDTFHGHRFFVTRHGVKEGLFDPETDTQHRYEASIPGETFVIPESAAPSSNLCQDRFSICESEAERTGCTSGIGWMIVHCCKSCDKYVDSARLIDPKVRCSKENLNTTDAVWKPGDLNQLFASWATQDEFAHLEPKVLSSPDGGKYGGKDGPFVLIFDNFLTHEEADALILGGEMMGFERSTNQGAINALGEKETVVSTTRTSSNAWCRGECEELPEVKSVTRKIEEVTQVPKDNFESFQILEYGRDQFYRMHHDSTGGDTTPDGPRIMTFFLYLSDVEEGGETYFNNLDIAVKPKKGRALVWPSVKNEDPHFWDDRMYHEAKDVIKGKKYAANHWIHLRDSVTPNEWGCTGSFG
eukprot:CAMPEP_0195521286 /NCGR_PEP_ID=MMETSP0794_2-20130614/18381_1 /TAXON_ID=515487 /ORGANISM="Stephanopyxis turris, Strain CCMP 815" /LENGTH=452 /DNA_ID=CAMNT_0040650807 /DNA_START=44 /DNA_END=1402 /DNA_ORIENTATION=+